MNLGELPHVSKRWHKLILNSVYPPKPTNATRFYDPDVVKSTTERGKLVLKQIQQNLNNLTK